MRAALERLARRWWSGELGSAGRALDVLTAPASWMWAGASGLRARRRVERGACIAGARVVSVGNLAVGGTGKTPLAAWVARRLAASGARTTVLVGPQGADEGELHARWNPAVPVRVDRNRARAAVYAATEGAQAVVLDDGFQHFALGRDLDVVLLSADDPFPAPVLPRGPYRERAGALARADAIVVTRRQGTAEAARRVAEHARTFAPDALSAGLRLAPGPLFPLGAWAQGGGGEATSLGLDRLDGSTLAVCGVGRPDLFREAVAGRAGGPVGLLSFPDHRAYTSGDVERVREVAAGRPVVVTEKDAVKLAAHEEALGPTFVLTERLHWEWGEEALARRVTALVAETVSR